MRENLSHDSRYNFTLLNIIVVWWLFIRKKSKTHSKIFLIPQPIQIYCRPCNTIGEFNCFSAVIIDLRNIFFETTCYGRNVLNKSPNRLPGHTHIYKPELIQVKTSSGFARIRETWLGSARHSFYRINNITPEQWVSFAIQQKQYMYLRTTCI